MALNKIIDQIDILPTTNNYWFVRTDGGQNYETFLDNDFIAIGWNDILLSDLDKTASEVKAKIARIFQLDTKISKDKGKATDIYNKLMRFKNLRKDDIVVMPSENSKYLAFGVVEDDKLFSRQAGENKCEYQKRRKIKWITSKEFDTLDDVFFKIRKSRHSLSDINEHSEKIDSVMYSVYKKGDDSHFVVRVTQGEDVNWLNLGKTLVEMHELLTMINQEFSLNEDINNSSIQISIQSPGLFNLKQSGIALILLATMLGAESCSDVKSSLPNNNKHEFEKFQEDKKKKLDSIKSHLDNMAVTL